MSPIPNNALMYKNLGGLGLKCAKTCEIVLFRIECDPFWPQLGQNGPKWVVGRFCLREKRQLNQLDSFKSVK